MPIITILFGESIITKGSKKNSPHNYSEMGLSNRPASNKANRLIRLTRDDNDNDDTGNWSGYDSTTGRREYYSLTSYGMHGAGALDQWLWEDTHVLTVVGLNPRSIYWMDINLL